VFLVSGILLLGSGNLSWGQCPQPYDLGQCDTFYVECYNPVQFDPPSWDIFFTFLITHDVTDPAIDSLDCVYIPFEISHSHPAAYCSVLSRRNQRLYASDTANSIFRHFGGMRNRLMDLHEQGNGAEWEQGSSDIGYGRFNLTIGPWGVQDQAWWESSRVLFATMTLVVSDTMTILIKGERWPPDDIEQVIFCRMDAFYYRPQQNFLSFFKITHMPRGDANGDQVINISDVMFMMNYLFRHGSPPVNFETGDANCDNDHGILDVVCLINYLYKNGPVPHCT